jgi:hypothetical protein
VSGILSTIGKSGIQKVVQTFIRDDVMLFPNFKQLSVTVMLDGEST